MSSVAMKIFFGVFAAGLLVCAVLLIRETGKILREYRAIRREWCMSPEEVKDGHSGRTRGEVRYELGVKRLELISWVIFSGASVFAFCDCLTRVIK